MTPFFSVIIPLYNKEAYIYATITSALNQSFANFEIIIINDGSTDGSLNKVQSIQDKRISIFTIKNQGVSYARNYGIKKASSNFIALIDADDIWYKNHLEELHKSILKFPNADLFCNRYEVLLSEGIKKNGIYNIPKSGSIIVVKDFFKASLISSIARISASAFNKKTFFDIKMFNSLYRSGQDTDLWIRFGLNKKIVFNPKITSCYNNIVEQSLSKRNYNVDRYNIIKSYTNVENNHKSLKHYLDINRYAIAIRCKMNNENELYKTLKKEIDYSNLNNKQKILLRLPKFLLMFIKRCQYFLIKKEIYLTSYT